ncbi:MAG: tetratricopeptide repeat protein, partial [bacterium]|nr:tetratricopeptide repeat protein [bacterium]
MPRLLVGVFAVMVVLFVATGFLTRSYNREKQQRAERQFEDGQRLAGQGRYEDSIEQYTAALVLARGKREYRQALALALMEAGRTSEAESYLIEISTEDPSNGVVNLTLARIRAERGEIQQAVQNYQRAAYGLWPEDPVGNRTRVHFELIELLAKNRQNRLVTAELLRLLDEVPDDPELKRRIGRMFLDVGATENAKAIFGELTEADVSDGKAWAGLGDAEFELGRFLSARTAYRNAVRRSPDDLQSRVQYELVTDIVNLDPTRRGLGIATRLERSRLLIERALSFLEYCIGDNLEAFGEEFRSDVEQARKILAGRARQRLRDEFVEANIALTERLLGARMIQCGAPPVPDRA